MKPGWKTVVLVTLVNTNVCVVLSQSPITCTAGYYKPGDTATVTCDYHGDVNTAENSGAYIRWRGLQASRDSSGIEVLSCGFTQGALSVCNPEDGYSFVSFKDNKLIIQIPFVEAKFQGRYSCGVVSPSGSGLERPVRQCLLVVEGAGRQKTDAPPNSETHEALHSHVRALLVLLVILIIAVAGVTVYAVLAYRTRWFPFRKKAEIQNVEEVTGATEACLGGQLETQRDVSGTSMPSNPVAQQGKANSGTEHTDDLEKADKETNETMGQCKEEESVEDKIKALKREKKENLKGLRIWSDESKRIKQEHKEKKKLLRQQGDEKA